MSTTTTDPYTLAPSGNAGPADPGSTATAGIQAPTAANQDPFGLGANLDNKVLGVNELLGLNLTTGATGTMTVRQAIDAYRALAARAASGDALAVPYLAQMQQELYEAGYYPKDYTPILGQVRTEDLRAFANASVDASTMQTPMSDYLSSAAQSGRVSGAGTATPSNRVFPGGQIEITQTDPETIRLGANAAYQKLLGRDASDGEAQGIVDSVRADEAKKGGQRVAIEDSQRIAQAQAQTAVFGGGTAAASGGAGGAPQGSAEVMAAITKAASETGVPLSWALAVANQESGLNPSIAVEDHHADGSPAGMSVGLFQLNDNGQGAGMTVAQRQDAYTNAKIALTHIADVMRQHPDWSPGQIVAASQGPADAQGYAAKINAALSGQGVDTSGSGAVASSPTPNDKGTDTYLPAVGTPVSSPITPEGAATQQIQSQSVPEMQEYGLQRQVQNFTSALHSMPGDAGASRPAAVKP